jgi:hypothetical protein
MTERNNLGNRDIDERMILQYVGKKQSRRAWIGLILLRMGEYEGFLIIW